MGKPILSIVVPCYNEEKCVQLFVDSVAKIKLAVAYEILFVDDGSKDGTLAAIKKECANKRNEGVKMRYISFSRNFGKEAALFAGLKNASGEIIVTMDVDGQDPPSFLPQMIAGIEDGYDSVATRRADRKGEPIIRSCFARLFYKLMCKFSNVALVDGARDYRMMRRKVVDAILSMPENNRFTKGIYQWVGFKTKWIDFPNCERVAGDTKWSFWKLFKYSIDGILAFSTMPLQLASGLGAVVCTGSAVSLVWIYLRALIFGNPVAGWPSLVCIVMFLGGVQLFMIGILGAYMAKIYLETKRRPMYFIAEASDS